MNYQFRTLSAESLPKLATLDDLKLTQLAQQLDDFSSFEQLQEFADIEFESLHTLEEIFLKIEQEKSEDIQFIEWVFCLQSKDEWESENSARTQRLAKRIWQIARHNSWLKQMLLWLFIQGHSEPILANALTNTISEFLDSDARESKELVEVIRAIAHRDYLTIARRGCDRALTPQDLLKELNLPQPVAIVNKVLNEIVEVFASKGKPDWLINCFEQMSREQQVEQVQLLFKRVSPEKGSNYPSLVAWLRDNYGHRTANSRWRSLDYEALIKLLEWLNAATWSDFEKVVNVLLSRLEITKQLKSRRTFWSHYSQSFNRFLILLPQKSFNKLNKEFKQNVDVLISDGSEETEVCIFDFGGLYVVEFFRGAGSETRLFSRQQNPEIEQKLFTDSELSVKKLRCLGGEACDHVFLWQYYTEKLLREKYKIFPNSKIKEFKGLPPDSKKYNPNTGLSSPSPEDKQERNRQLRTWQSQIEKLEQKAKAYCQTVN